VPAPPADLLQAGPNRTPRWPRWARWLTHWVFVAALLLLGAGALLQRMDGQPDRPTRMGVSISVEARSNDPDGGRVDFTAVLRNEGNAQVRITGLTIGRGRLRATARRQATAALPAGGSLAVPLSVTLDCRAGRLATAPPVLPGVITTTRSDGTPVAAHVLVTDARRLTQPAQTLCQVSHRRFNELSGPVGLQRPAPATQNRSADRPTRAPGR
jgi:hypothetical protein